MSRRHTYSFIYNVQRIILLVFYSTTAIALSIPLARLAIRISPDNLFLLIASLVLYMVVVVVIGSLIHVVSYIPFNLANAFDPIKNDIASRTIKDIDQLGARISSFTTGFFNFSFLDIAHAFLQTGKSGIISHEDFSEVKDSLAACNLPEKSKEAEIIMYAGKIHYRGTEYHLYILPIWFGDRWLGYMGMLSRHRISWFFKKFLAEYENNFLDDQIMHVMKCSNKE